MPLAPCSPAGQGYFAIIVNRTKRFSIRQSSQHQKMLRKTRRAALFCLVASQVYIQSPLASVRWGVVSPVPRRRGGLRGGELLGGFDAGTVKPTPFGLGNLALVDVLG